MTVQASLRVGSRTSRLAGAQAALFIDAFSADGEAGPTELVEVRTRGDAISVRHPAGGFEVTDGQFTAELEQAVMSGEVDVAVHSYKDLPTLSTPDAVVAAVLLRGDARDCLLTRAGGGLRDLPGGAVVGTSSARRALQLLAARADVEVRPIRGNIDTRIERMRRGEYDAIVLACAGIERLGIEAPADTRLPFETMLPAPGQGALAIQVRGDRHDLIGRLARLDHAPTRVAVGAERALLRAVGGGCLAPLGTVGEITDGQIRLRAIYFADPPVAPVRVDIRDSVGHAAAVVAEAARQIHAGSRR
jgi:hydroxymethylbilane synthase